MKIEWIVDFGAEFILKKLGIEYSRKAVTVSLVDRKASAENRAREVPLNLDRVGLIANAAQIGTPLPAIVLRLRSDGRYVIVGGNHRFNAAIQLEQKDLSAYVIKCTDVEFETLCKQLNIVEGQGAELAERMTWAARDVLRESITQIAAAERYNLNIKKVGEAVRLLRVQNRLDSLGPARKTILNQGHLNSIGDLAGNDNILNAAAEFIAAGATTSELREVSRRARHLTTEADQVNEFTAATVIKLELAKKPIKRTKRTAFLAWISNGETLCKTKELAGLEILESETVAIRVRLQSLIDSLKCLCEDNG